MFVGAALRDGTAAALSYTSDDLQHWTYAGTALSRSTAETDPVWMGALWECPQILEIDGRAFMISSVWDDDVLHYAGYATGSYADGILVPDGWGRLTYGDSYYAPSLFTDADGRPCLVFWMRGVTDQAAGWAGAHSVPYLLSHAGGRLVASVHPDVTKHRTERVDDGRVDTPAADIVWTDGEAGELTIETDSALVRIRWDDGELTVVQSSASGEQPTLSAPVSDPVRILLDGPIVEISSAAGLLGAVMGIDSAGLRVAADRGELEIHTLR
jgi:beta-fructofuranosidase